MNTKKITKISTISLVMFMLMPLYANGQNILYRYKDKSGNIVYADNIPAGEKGKIEILSSKTMILKEISEAELTPEQYEKKAESKKEEENIKKEKESTNQVQKIQDQSLLSQYANISEIDDLKEYEINTINRSLKDNKDILDNLKKRKEELLTSAKDKNGATLKKIEEEVKSIETNIEFSQKSIAKSEDMKKTRIQKYENDKQRYKEILDKMAIIKK